MSSTSFETKFGILADAHLSEQVPAIKKYMLGFQTVATEDDNARALGIVAYKIGNRLIYVPMFWLNGRLKGGDVMYQKQEDIFLPLSEIWINFIETGKNFTLGDLGKNNSDQTGGASRVSTTDLNWLHSKRASEIGIIDRLTLARIAAAPKEAPPITLATHLALFKKSAAEDLAIAITKEAKVANAFFRLYSPSEIGATFKPYLGSTVKKAAEELLHVYSDKYAAEAKDLDEEAKLELVKDGVYIDDKRKETSIAYKVKPSVSKYTSPDKSGAFNVLLSNFDIVPRMIFLTGDARRKAIVISPDSNKYSEMELSDVTVETTSKPDEKETLDKIKAVDATASNFIDIVSKSPSYRKVILYCPTDSKAIMGSLSISAEGTVSFMPTYQYTGDKKTVSVTEKPGKLGLESSSHIYIPNDVKIIDIDEMTASYSDSSFNPVDIVSAVVETPEIASSVVKVASDGRNYHISTAESGKGSLTYKDALVSLVKDQGLAAKQAKEILAEAKAQTRVGHTLTEVSFYVKKAMDEEPDQESYGDDHTKETEIVGSNTGITKKSIDDIYKASQSGVKEVLDTKVLSELAKSAYPVDRVSEFLPGLIKSLDKLGRILFLFYWNNDQFSDRYGKQNMASIEDSIRDNIRALGDLVMYLKEKTISSDATINIDDANEDLTKNMF